jgi:PAS domain S-box-containing protein
MPAEVRKPEVEEHLSSTEQSSDRHPAYRDIVEHSLDCVCVHDARGTILSVNPAFVRAVDAQSEEDLVGLNLAELLDPAVRDRFPGYLETINARRQAEGTMRVRTRSGQIRVFDYRNSLREGDEGVVVYAMARDITEAERARKRLAASEMRFRHLFERSLAVVMITTFDGRFLDANEETVRLVAAPSREALMAGNVADYYVDQAARLTMVDVIRERRSLPRRQVRVRRHDGTETWIVANSTLIDFGPPHGDVILTTALDISEIKKFEESITSELQRSKHDYRGLFDHSHDPILILEPHSERVLEVNRAACEAYRLDRQSFVGRSMLEFSLPNRPNRSAEIARAHGAFVDFDTFQLRVDGTVLDLEVSAGLIDYNGAPAIVSINRDVTEKRRIELQREQAYARVSAVAREWSSTFDAVPNPIIVADEEFRVRRANRAAMALLQCGPPLTHLSLDDVPGEPWYTVGALCRGGIDVSVEVVAGDRIWDVSLTVQNDEQLPDSRYIIILRDVTATHDLQKSLRRAETISTMGSLVAGVLHEVRNPLFSISAAVDALEARTMGRPGAKYIERLRGDVGRLRKIMSDLLEYGRPHMLDMHELQLQSVLSAAAAACAVPAVAAGVTIEIDCAPLRIRADSDRLRQVFQNLIENAVQHSPSGTAVTVRARDELRRGTWWVIVDVEDEGGGFAAGDLHRLFEPFFTKRRGGTGLGLSIVRKIVEEHGGNVEASNLRRGGGVVSVAIPQQR